MFLKTRIFGRSKLKNEITNIFTKSGIIWILADFLSQTTFLALDGKSHVSFHL